MYTVIYMYIHHITPNTSLKHPAHTHPIYALNTSLHGRYHGHTIAIVWDQDGTHYGKGKGLLLYVDGKVVASSPTIGKLTAVL